MTDAEGDSSLSRVVSERVGRAFPSLVKPNVAEELTTIIPVEPSTPAANQDDQPLDHRECTELPEAVDDTIITGSQVADKEIHSHELRTKDEPEQEEPEQELDNLILDDTQSSLEEQVQRMTAMFDKLCQRQKQTQQDMLDMRKVLQTEHEDVIEMRKVFQTEREDSQGALRDLRKEVKLINLTIQNVPPYKQASESGHGSEVNNAWALNDSVLAPIAPVGSTETLSPVDGRVQRLEDKVAFMSKTYAERTDLDDIHKKLKTMEHVDAKQVHDRLQALQTLVESLVTDFKTEVERAGETVMQSPFSAIVARSPGAVFPGRDSGTVTPAFACQSEYSDALVSKSPGVPSKESSIKRGLSAPLRASIQTISTQNSHAPLHRINSARGTSGLRIAGKASAETLGEQPRRSTSASRAPAVSLLQDWQKENGASGRLARGLSPVSSGSTIGMFSLGPRGHCGLRGAPLAGAHSVQRMASPSPPHCGISFPLDSRMAMPRTTESPTRRCAGFKGAVAHDNAVQTIIVGVGTQQRSLSPPQVRHVPHHQWSFRRPTLPATDGR